MSQKIRNKIKSFFFPSPSSVNFFFEKINDFILKIKVLFPKEYLEISLGGSFAKGTFLKDSDVDIFWVVPHKKISLKNYFEKFSRRIKDNFQYKKIFSEQPYFRIRYHDIEIDLVLCYPFLKTSFSSSVADRSLSHVSFMCKELSQEQKEDIRILKLLLIQNELYGSKIYGSFTGYSLECLIFFHKSFDNLIKYFQNLDLNFFNFKKKDFFFLKDPVDSKRNVLSVLTKKFFLESVYLFKNFYFDEIFFFHEKKFPFSKKIFARLFGISFFPKNDLGTIIPSKIESFIDEIKNIFRRNLFFIHYFFFQNRYFLFFEYFQNKNFFIHDSLIPFSNFQLYQKIYSKVKGFFFFFNEEKLYLRREEKKIFFKKYISQKIKEKLKNYFEDIRFHEDEIFELKIFKKYHIKTFFYRNFNYLKKNKKKNQKTSI